MRAREREREREMEGRGFVNYTLTHTQIQFLIERIQKLYLFGSKTIKGRIEWAEFWSWYINL